MSEEKQAQPQVFHYECFTPDRLTIMSDKGNIVFRGGQFTTSNDKIAKSIEGSKQFKLGHVWRSEGIIVGSNKKAVSGARGTRVIKPKDLSPAEKIAQMKAMELPEAVIEAAKKELSQK